MKIAPISRLKASLSEYLDAVREGEEVIITDRGKPVARLVPIGGEKAARERVARLVRRGVLSPALKPRAGNLTPPAGKKPTGTIAALIEEQEEGR